MSETKLVREIQEKLSKGYVRLFRNNVGRMQTEDGRWVHFGLCSGSSDLIGWKSVRVTQEMVGMRVAIFTAIEVKTERGIKRENLDQANFIFSVLSNGGIADRVTSIDQARQVLNIEDDADTVPP